MKRYLIVVKRYIDERAWLNNRDVEEIRKGKVVGRKVSRGSPSG